VEADSRRRVEPPRIMAILAATLGGGQRACRCRCSRRFARRRPRGPAPARRSRAATPRAPSSGSPSPPYGARARGAAPEVGLGAVRGDARGRRALLGRLFEVDAGADARQDPQPLRSLKIRGRVVEMTEEGAPEASRLARAALHRPGGRRCSSHYPMQPSRRGARATAPSGSPGTPSPPRRPRSSHATAASTRAGTAPPKPQPGSCTPAEAAQL
jgi:hypothetical protein